MTVLVVCGPPRSSTTWIHNELIASGRYFGVRGVDTQFSDFSDENVFFSNEDWFVTYYGIQAKHSVFHHHFARKFSQRMDRYESRFSKDGYLLLESPYYVFLIDLFFDRYKEELRVVYMKRNCYDVATSMTKHPHLSPLLKKPIRRSVSFYANGFFPIELNYADQFVLNYARKEYNQLEMIDRALFKWHCFDNAFSKISSGLGAACYEFNATNPVEEDFEKLGRFCDLNKDSVNIIATQFKSAHYDEPKIDSELAHRLKWYNLSLRKS